MCSTGSVSVCVVDGWLYTAGGSQSSSSLKQVERYDTRVNEWRPVEGMKLPRREFGMVGIEGRLYAVGGHNGVCEVDLCETFDPLTDTWSDIAHLNKPRRGHAVCTYGGKLFAVGGMCSSRVLDCIEKYNKGLEMWLIIKHTLDPRVGACVAEVRCDDGSGDLKNDKHLLFVIGGINGLHHHQRDVKMLDLKSVDYSIAPGTSLNFPGAYGGVVAL